MTFLFGISENGNIQLFSLSLQLDTISVGWNWLCIDIRGIFDCGSKNVVMQPECQELGEQVEYQVLFMFDHKPLPRFD